MCPGPGLLQVRKSQDTYNINIRPVLTLQHIHKQIDRNIPAANINWGNDDTITEITEESDTNANIVTLVIADYCVTTNTNNVALVDTVEKTII